MVVLTLLANFFTNSNVVNNHFLEYYYQLLDAWLYKKTRPVLCCEKIFFFFFSGFLELKYVCIDFIMEILFVLSHKSPKDISVLEIKKTKYLVLLMLLKFKKLNIISLKTNLLILHELLFLRLYDVNRIQTLFFFVFDIIQIFWKLTVVLNTSIYLHPSFLWEFLSIYSLQKFIKIKMKCLKWTKQFYKNSIYNMRIKTKSCKSYCDSFLIENILTHTFKSVLIKIFRTSIKTNYKLYQNIFLMNKMHIFAVNFCKIKFCFSCKKIFKPKYIKLNSVFHKMKLFNNIYIKKKFLILKNVFKLQIEVGLFFFHIFQEKFKLNISFFNLKLKEKYKKLIINICILHHMRLYYTTSNCFYFATPFFKKFLPKTEKSLKKKNKFFYKRMKVKFKEKKQINYKTCIFFIKFFFSIFGLRLKFLKKNSLSKKSKKKIFFFDFFDREFFYT